VRALLGDAAALEDVGRREAGRLLVDEMTGTGEVELLRQAGEVPGLRADLDIALEAPARAEHGQGLRHHLLLLLEQRRHGVAQVGEEGLDALELLLHVAVDRFLVAMPLQASAIR
jgi:hypothetical protein